MKTYFFTMHKICTYNPQKSWKNTPILVFCLIYYYAYLEIPMLINILFPLPLSPPLQRKYFYSSIPNPHMRERERERERHRCMMQWMTRLVSMMTWICITVKTKNKKRRLEFAQVKTRIGKERDVGAFVTCELGYLLFCR